MWGDWKMLEMGSLHQNKPTGLELGRVQDITP